MNLLIAALLGVVVGMIMSTVLILFLIQKRVDRDLIERRVRAYEEYSECLRGLVELLDSADDSPGGVERVVDQAWWGVRNFCREFRLSGWVLDGPAREHLERVVVELEAERCKYEESDMGPARAAHFLSERHRQLERFLDRRKAVQVEAFRRFRYFPSPRGASAALPGSTEANGGGSSGS
ncbi:MAG: hypothetical protein MK538_17635 [Planctomycetes bacterium]|nr:hypothetical protein [Planctomycetota bacterium]